MLPDIIDRPLAEPTMHQVENYDLVISRDPASDREVLLLAAEFADVPEHLGSPKAAQWVDGEDGKQLDLVFEAQDGTRTPVRFARIAHSLADKLTAFDRVLVVWLGSHGVVGEEEIPLAA